MRKQYITPYDVKSLTCTAPSNELPAGTPVEAFLALGAKIVSQSKRLTLIDLDGSNGLCLSDIPYSVCN